MRTTHRADGGARKRPWALALGLGAAAMFVLFHIPWAVRLRQLRGPMPPGVFVEARPDGPPLLRVDPGVRRRLGLHVREVGADGSGLPPQALVRVQGRPWVYVEIRPGLFRRMEWPWRTAGRPGSTSSFKGTLTVVDRAPSQLLAWEQAGTPPVTTPAPF